MNTDTKPSYSVRKLAELHRIAESKNCTLFQASANHLLLDYDHQALKPHDFEELLQLVSDRFGSAEVVETWTSRGGNLHVIVRIGIPLTVSQRRALQAALGSDPKREIIGIWEETYCDEASEDTNTLFKPKEAR